MSKELIIRDWHLKKGDKVAFGDSYLVYDEEKGLYKPYLD